MPIENEKEQGVFFNPAPIGSVFSSTNRDWNFACFKEFNNCYILLSNSSQTLENTTTDNQAKKNMEMRYDENNIRRI